MWENKTNGKTYVGSSQDLRKRIQDYFDKHVLSYSGSKIYKAILKYGHDNFIFKVLEYCPVKDLMVREQYYLDTLEPEYNILKYAKSSRGYLHSEATKEHLAAARKEWEYSPEQLQNFSLNSVLNKFTLLTNVVTGETIFFLSMKKAAEFLGMSSTSVRRYIDENLPYNDYKVSQPSLEEDKENNISSKPQTIILTKVSDLSPTKSEEFPTIEKAAEYLGVNRSTLNNNLNKSNDTGDNLCIINGFIVSRSDKSLNYIKPNSRALEITDLVSNTTVVYPSMSSAALALGVGKGSISMYLKSKQISPYKNRYIIKSAAS